MRIEVIKNFVTEKDLKVLNNWVTEAITNGWIDTGLDKSYRQTRKRLTSRFYGHRFRYPKEIIDLSDKVRSVCGITDYPLIVGHGNSGIVVSCTFAEGDVYKHRDPLSKTGLETLRCNILSQESEVGGKLFVEGKEVELDVGDLHCYLASEHEHWATKVEGNTPRIMWMFGAHVPKEDWNNGTIKVNNGLS